MSAMGDLKLREVSELIRLEAQEDYVGLWQIHRLLEERGASSPRRIAQVVDILLRGGSVDVGDFSAGQFSRWDEPVDAAVDRVEREVQKLDRPPDIGEVAWLVAR